jgi:hypothetical protein
MTKLRDASLALGLILIGAVALVVLAPARWLYRAMRRRR